jgi:hypothetical protein
VIGQADAQMCISSLDADRRKNWIAKLWKIDACHIYL